MAWFHKLYAGGGAASKPTVCLLAPPKTWISLFFFFFAKILDNNSLSHTCQSQDHSVFNRGTTGARNTLAQELLQWDPHCNLARDASSHHKSGKLWKNKQGTILAGERACNPFSYLKPTIGHSLQMLHLAWCFAVSAAATRCRTGSHTIDCGSKRIQSINCFTVISGLLWFWGK